MEEHMGNMGSLNGHSVGRILKEAVRRATVVIRSERATFEATAKRGYGGNMDDVFTSADVKAQEIYLRTFRECFSGFGVVAEEKGLKILAHDAYAAFYFTVDPLDGTKAYVRRQSHGVGTMVALVHHKDVISAYIGDINTEEMYGYRPGSDRVWRITRLDTFEELKRTSRKRLNFARSHILLRDPLTKYRPISRELAESGFKSYEIMGSSIGTWMARLWKGEVHAALMTPGHETPWDSTPIIGISKKLGFVFLRPKNKRSKEWVQYEPALTQEPYYRDHDTLVIHRHDLKNLV